MTQESISLDDIERAFERVILRLRSAGIVAIELDGNQYQWRVALDEALKANEPRAVLGDLCEDIQRLTTEQHELDFVSLNYIQSLASVIQLMASGSVRQAL